MTLTDHDRLTLIGHLHGEGGSAIPLLIPAKEALDRSPGVDTEVHINALGISKQALPQMEGSREKIHLKIEQDWDYVYTTHFTGQGALPLLRTWDQKRATRCAVMRPIYGRL